MGGTKITDDVGVNVYARNGGQSPSIAGATISSATISNGIFSADLGGNPNDRLTYKVPLNPVLTRGTIGKTFETFTTPSNEVAITSYEIHKADNTTLTNARIGINRSYADRTGGIESTTNQLQTLNSINRLYPNTTTVDDHLSNLITTRGNKLKIFDATTGEGQRVVTDTTYLNLDISNIQTNITLATSGGMEDNDIIIINNEEMFIVTDGGSGNLTVIRGYNNTTPTAHSRYDRVLVKDKIDSMWVLVYSDDENKHHFAKVTEFLEDDVYGDSIEFEPSLGVDIPKDTKFAIFSSYDANLPKIDSDNQTLVACGYGLKSSSDNTMNYLNTIVARPLFYFLNGKDKLEPSTRYILRTSSWNGTVHKRTYF